MFNIFLIPNQW